MIVTITHGLRVMGGRWAATECCPYCGNVIGFEKRCPHVDILLTPKENGGQWGLLVRKEPFDIPLSLNKNKVIEPSDEEPDPEPHPFANRTAEYGERTAAVLSALTFGDATCFELYMRMENCTIQVIRATLHRLLRTCCVRKITNDPRRNIAVVYALTTKGMRRAKKLRKVVA